MSERERDPPGRAGQPADVEALLLGWLDGTLTADERARARALLSARPDLARLVEQHRRVWEWMGEAEQPSEAAPAEGFPADLGQRARREEARRRGALRGRVAGLAAAAALLVAGLWWWTEDRAGWQRLSREDRTIVQNLDLLENLDVLRDFGPELDLAAEMEVLRAFDGELPEEVR